MFEINPASEVPGVRVQRVLMPGGAESWTVIDATGEPVASVEAYLAHLQALDRSPTTVRAYATNLKLWIEFLGGIGVGWDESRAEHVSRFVAWLRAPADNVVVLEAGTSRRGQLVAVHHSPGGDGCKPVAPVLVQEGPEKHLEQRFPGLDEGDGAEPGQVGHDQCPVDLLGTVQRWLPGGEELREAGEGKDAGDHRGKGAVEPQTLAGPGFGSLPQPGLGDPGEAHGAPAPLGGHAQLLGPPHIGGVRVLQPSAAQGILRHRDAARRAGGHGDTSSSHTPQRSSSVRRSPTSRWM